MIPETYAIAASPTDAASKATDLIASTPVTKLPEPLATTVILCEAFTVIALVFLIIVGNEPDANVKSPAERTLSAIVTAPLSRSVGRLILTSFVMSIVVPDACERFIDLLETFTLPPVTFKVLLAFKETDTFFLTSA